MRNFLIAAALLSLSANAAADESCKHRRPVDETLNLRGVEAVIFDIGAHALDLRSGKASPAAIGGAACASSPNLLSGLRLIQSREGGKLIVRPEDATPPRIFGGSSRYAYFNLTVTLPDDMPVRLRVGSGDAAVSGAPSLSLDLGSGNVKVNRITGPMYVDIGSGEVEAANIGALHVVSIGSGQLDARDIASLKAGSVGSGELSVGGVRGDATIDRLASGSLEILGTHGDVDVGAVGSGEVDLREIGGDVRAGTVGSGSIAARTVHGDLSVSRIGSGSVTHRDVSGMIRLPRKD